MSERYEFIDAEYEHDDHPDAPTVGQMCRWLSVSRSGYYEWRSRPASDTARRRAELKIKIGVLFDSVRFGAPGGQEGTDCGSRITTAVWDDRSAA